MRNVTLLIALTLTLFGCSKRQPDYLPLTGKRELKYSLQYQDAMGLNQTGTVVARRDGEEIINGNQYEKVISVSSAPGTEAITTYFREANDGIYAVYGADKPIIETLWLPLPATVGRSWTITDSDGQVHYTIDSIESAELVDHRYDNCLKVSYSGTGSAGDCNGFEYIAPGIGQVRYVIKKDGRLTDLKLQEVIP